MTKRTPINKVEVTPEFVDEAPYHLLEHPKDGGQGLSGEFLSSGCGGVRDKELGLSLSLLSLAEVQAGRLKRLLSVIQIVEARIFTEETLRSLDPRSLLVLYKLASTNMDKTSEYVTSILKTVDWKELEARVAILDRDEGGSTKLLTDDTNMKELAGTLLAQFTQAIDEK